MNKNDMETPARDEMKNERDARAKNDSFFNWFFATVEKLLHFPLEFKIDGKISIGEPKNDERLQELFDVMRDDKRKG